MRKPGVTTKEETAKGSFIGGFEPGEVERVGGAPPWDWDAQPVCVIDASTLTVELGVFESLEDGGAPRRKFILEGESLNGAVRIVAGGHLMWNLCRAVRAKKAEIERPDTVPTSSYDPGTGQMFEDWEGRLCTEVRQAIAHADGAFIIEFTGYGAARSKTESPPRQFNLARRAPEKGPWRELAMQAAQHARSNLAD